MSEQTPRRTRDEILGITFSYLVEHGLENTSIRDLCKKMKISFSSIYYWFDGKEDIFISAAKVGIRRVVDDLFKYVNATMHDLPLFFDGFLEELDKYKHELRLIFQITTSPLYGDHMRNQADGFKVIYETQIKSIASEFNFPEEEVAPIIYLLISIVVDYVIWEDIEASRLQLNYLCKRLSCALDK